MTIDSFAEKLLLPAIELKNFPLMEVLLNIGVDVNHVDQFERYFERPTGSTSNISTGESISALKLAIVHNDESLVRNLLELWGRRVRTRSALPKLRILAP